MEGQMRTLLASREIPHRKVERIEGKTRKSHVMVCDSCPKEGELVDRSDTWLTPQRVLHHFRAKGWGIGRDRTRDTCPSCLAAQREGRREAHMHVDRPVLTLMSTTALEKIATAEAPEVEADALIAEATVLEAEAAALEPPTRSRRGRPNTAHTPIYPPRHEGRQNSPINTRGFTSDRSANRAAQRYLSLSGMDSPTEGLDYSVSEHLGDGWGWDRIEHGARLMPEDTVVAFQPELAVEAPPVVQPEPEPPPDPETERISTLAERKRIRGYLAKHYDEDNERWRGDLSDQRASEDLAMPPAWVMRVLEETFGPDVN
jgi:hypothetical protein